MDNSPIYSLLAFGRERFFAGAGRNCILKGFDLRISGGRTYYASDAQHCSSQPVPPKSRKPKNFCCDYHYSSRFDRRNFNLHVRPNSIAGNHKVRFRNPQDYSPIYSLSSPSTWSPTIYAGIEEAVIQIDATSLSDKHPDPVFKRMPDPVMKGARGTYGWPYAKFSEDVLSLVVQEESALMKQSTLAPLPSTRQFKQHSRWDERWEAVPTYR